MAPVVIIHATAGVIEQVFVGSTTGTSACSRNVNLPKSFFYVRAQHRAFAVVIARKHGSAPFRPLGTDPVRDRIQGVIIVSAYRVFAVSVSGCNASRTASTV